MRTNRKFGVSFNSPVVICFTAVCFAALALGWLTKGYHKRLFQCLPLLAAVAADICAADRPCVRSRRLGAFYQQYHAAIDWDRFSKKSMVHRIFCL